MEMKEVMPLNSPAWVSKSPFWRVERCRNCPNALIDLDHLERSMNRILKELHFESRRRTVLKTDRPLHHQVFSISVSGCPNSCSQPQIKDVGIQGQAVPVIGEGCTLCQECVRSCPDGCITLTEDGPSIQRSGCLNCGRCVRVCPSGTLTHADTGFRVMIGGKLGRRPRLAETVVDFGREEALVSTLKAVVEVLTDPQHADKRLGSVLEDLGAGLFRQNHREANR